MEENIKTILENFEKGSQQLEEALITMENFSSKLSESFKLTKNVENAINDVENIDFEKIDGVVENIKKSADSVEKQIDEAVKSIKKITKSIDALKNTTDDFVNELSDMEESLQKNNNNLLETIKKDNQEIRNDIAEIKELLIAKEKEEKTGKQLNEE